MAPELLQRVEDVCALTRSHHRIGLSEFSHGRHWRDDLHEQGIIEIMDRDKSAGWLISWECLNALTLRIQELEEDRERQAIETLIADRQDRTNWKRGNELAESAKTELHAHFDEWRELDDEH